MLNVNSAIISIAMTLVALLPLSFVRKLGRGLGYLNYCLNSNTTKVTRKNITLCFPELTLAEREKTIKNSVAETCILALETCLVWRHSTQWLEERIQHIYGDELIKNAVAKKKGLIVLAPHLGNWEVLGKLLPSYGDMVSLYAPPKVAALESVVKNARQSSGATLVPTNSRGIAKLLKALKRGSISGILPDQVPEKSSGEYAPFFGVTALTMSLIHGLHSRTQCDIVMAAALRVKNGFELHFLPVDPMCYSSDLNESVLGLNTSIENIVKLAPTQYQWEYKRFKRQKDKSVSYYDDLV